MPFLIRATFVNAVPLLMSCAIAEVMQGALKGAVVRLADPVAG